MNARTIICASLFVLGGLFMQKMGVESPAAYAFFGYVVGILHVFSVWVGDE